MCDEIKAPSECTKQEIEDFHQLVSSGGEVEVALLRSRIRRAKLLALHYEKDTLVATTALKRPNETYKKDVFRKARVSDESDRYSLEVGWAFTMEEYRGKGICSGLVQQLVNRSESEAIFATTRKHNLQMHRILKKNGFRKIGKQFKGRTNEYYLELFVRSVHGANC